MCSEISIGEAFRLLIPELCVGNCSCSFAMFAKPVLKDLFVAISMFLLSWSWFYIHSFVIFTLIQFSRLYLPYTTKNVILPLSILHRSTLACFARSTKRLQSLNYLRVKSATFTVLTSTLCTGFNMRTSPPGLCIPIATNLSRGISITSSPTLEYY
jgi:hypothetical protein